MTNTVLIYSGAVPGLVAALSEHFTVLGPRPEPLHDTLTESERASVRAYVAPGSVPSNLVASLPNLGLLACLGAGYDGVDLAFLRSRGIAVTHNPGGNAGGVAEMAVTLLLAVNRKLLDADRWLRAGHWPAQSPKPRGPYAPGLTGRKIGILGLGAIGSGVAGRLAGFEVEIGYHNRRRTDAPYRYCESVQALAAWADDLVIAVPGNAESRHIVDRTVLDALGPRGTLINVARGSVVDEEALIAALQEGRLAGAGLDVFADEPRVDPRLMALPNVVLTPHEGGMTVSATTRTRAMLVANLKAFFAGEALPNPVPG